MHVSHECASRKADNLPPFAQLSMTRRRSTGSRPPKAPRATAPAADWRGEDPNLELEKSRYADPIASRELLLKHLGEAPEPLTAARLAKRLGLHTAAQREALAKRLAAMVRDGQALEGPNGFAAAGEGGRLGGRGRGRARRRSGARPAQRRCAGTARRRFRTLGSGACRHGDADAWRPGRSARGRHE